MLIGTCDIKHLLIYRLSHVSFTLVGQMTHLSASSYNQVLITVMIIIFLLFKLMTDVWVEPWPAGRVGSGQLT